MKMIWIWRSLSSGKTGKISTSSTPPSSDSQNSLAWNHCKSALTLVAACEPSKLCKVGHIAPMDLSAVSEYSVYRNLLNSLVLHYIQTLLQRIMFQPVQFSVFVARHSITSALLLTLVTFQFLPLVILLGLVCLLLLVKQFFFFVIWVRNCLKTKTQASETVFLSSDPPPSVLYIPTPQSTPPMQADLRLCDMSEVRILPYNRCKLYYQGELEEFICGEDILLIPKDHDLSELKSAQVFTAYKPVDQKVRPISGTFPQEVLVCHNFPHEPLDGLPILSRNPPDFKPTEKITSETLKLIDINGEGFLWPEEEKLFAQVISLNEAALAFEETDRGTLHEDYSLPTSCLQRNIQLGKKRIFPFHQA